jgi:ABC-2 type transport system permease protein
MRTTLAMAVKDLVLITRDWMGLFFIIGFPILMGIFFGSMYGGVDEEHERADVQIAIVDDDRSDASMRFVKSLDDTPNITIENLPREQATDRVRRGDLVAMVVIPAKFGETAGIPWIEGPAIEVGVDPSRRAESAMIEGLVMKAAGALMVDRFEQVTTALKAFFGSSQQEQTREKAVDSADAGQGDEAASVSTIGFHLARVETIDVTRQPREGSIEEQMTKLRSQWDISFPQAMMWGVLGCAAAFAISIVRERKQGTLLRLQAAPISRAQLILGKALACFLAVIGVIVVMVALGTWLGMRPRSPGLLAIASVCVAFCFVGIMILMSVIGRSEEAVSGAAWGANMLMAMFGGGMIPLAFMPRFMVPLSQASPVKWSILSLEGAIWRGFTPAEMLLPCAILVAIGMVCLALGAVRLTRMSA